MLARKTGEQLWLRSYTASSHKERYARELADVAQETLLMMCQVRLFHRSWAFSGVIQQQ